MSNTTLTRFHEEKTKRPPAKRFITLVGHLPDGGNDDGMDSYCFGLQDPMYDRQVFSSKHINRKERPPGRKNGKHEAQDVKSCHQHDST